MFYTSMVESMFLPSLFMIFCISYPRSKKIFSHKETPGLSNQLDKIVAEHNLSLFVMHSITSSHSLSANIGSQEQLICKKSN